MSRRTLSAFMGCLLWVLFSGVSASAQSSSDSLINEIQKTAQISEILEPSCPSTLPADSELVIAFDGMKGYCPRHAALLLKQWNSDSSLSSQADGNSQAQDAMASVLATESQPLHGCFLVNAIARLQLPESQIRNLIYYSKSGADSALTCVMKLERLSARAGGPPLHIHLIGYSMGGFAATKLANHLQAQGVRVGAVLTIDPIGEGLRWIHGVLTSDSSDYFKKPASVALWKNYFQKIDYSSITHGMGLKIGIRGNQVQGANEEYQINAEEMNLSHSYPHVEILNTQRVQDALRESLFKE